MTAFELLKSNLAAGSRHYAAAARDADAYDIHADARTAFIEELCEDAIYMDLYDDFDW